MEASEAIPTLIALLQSKAPWRIIETATSALIHIAVDDARVRSLVPELLRSKSQFHRLKGLEILHSCHAPSPEMLDALAERFDDSDLLVLEAAIGATEAILVEPEQRLAFLRRPIRDSTLVRNCLRHPDSRPLCGILRVLTSLGEIAREELPSVVSHLQDAESYARSATVFAVCRMASPEDAVALTVGLLHDPDLFVRGAVFTCLAELGPTAKAAIPHLLAFIESTATVEANKAVDTICKIHGNTDDIVRCFEPLLKHRRPETRTAALYAIGKCRDNSRKLIEIILRGLDDPVDIVRVTAVNHLSGLRGEFSEIALPALCKALQDPATCGAAANAISSFREEGVAAIPALLEVLKTDELKGLGHYCAARTLYTLSREFAEECPPETVAELTKFGCRPIWEQESGLQ
jgi:HEAT repeat protein